MTNLGSIEAPAIKHICLVGDRECDGSGMMHTLILRRGQLGRVSSDECGTHMVRDAPTVRAAADDNSDALLTMRTDRTEE